MQHLKKKKWDSWVTLQWVRARASCTLATPPVTQWLP